MHGALIQQLLDCATACENCASSCLKEQDVNPMARCIELDRDCPELCYTSAKLLTRDSEIAHDLLAFCEKACRLCAEECAKHDHIVKSAQKNFLNVLKPVMHITERFN